MATTKTQLRDCAEQAGDKVQDLVCFYQPVKEGENYPGWNIEEQGDVVRCSFDDLPGRQFDAEYGAPKGEPTIAFSNRYVYIKIQYDGAEWFEAIPRHPEYVSKPIPWPGG